MLHVLHTKAAMPRNRTRTTESSLASTEYIEATIEIVGIQPFSRGSSEETNTADVVTIP